VFAFEVNDDSEETILKIRAGYDIAFKCLQDVPMILMLSVHPSRHGDLLSPHAIQTTPGVRAGVVAWSRQAV